MVQSGIRSVLSLTAPCSFRRSMSRADSHPHRWQEVFRTCKREADTLAAGLSPEAFNRAPADGVWSVGQCLDHLLEAGQPLVASLETALAAAPAAAPGAEPRLGLRDRLFVWAVQPHHWLTMPSPGAYRPSDETLDPERTLRAFAALPGRPRRLRRRRCGARLVRCAGRLAGQPLRAPQRRRVAGRHAPAPAPPPAPGATGTRSSRGPAAVLEAGFEAFSFDAAGERVTFRALLAAQ